jgi:hypothetical protein
MDAADSWVARLLAWGLLTVLTVGLVGSVLLDRARVPDGPALVIQEAARARALRSVEVQIGEAAARGDEEAMRWLEDLHQGISGLAVRRLGAL